MRWSNELMPYSWLSLNDRGTVFPGYLASIIFWRFWMIENSYFGPRTTVQSGRVLHADGQRLVFSCRTGTYRASSLSTTV